MRTIETIIIATPLDKGCVYEIDGKKEASHQSPNKDIPVYASKFCEKNIAIGGKEKVKVTITIEII